MHYIYNQEFRVKILLQAELDSMFWGKSLDLALLSNF